MSMVIDGSNGLTFPSGYSQTDIAVGSSNTAQTWQVVTGSRAGNTTYTNSTGRPILVCIYPTYVNGVGITVNGVAVGAANQSSSNTWMPSVIVPPGGTYSLTFTSGVTIGSWAELR